MALKIIHSFSMIILGNILWKDSKVKNNISLITNLSKCFAVLRVLDWNLLFEIVESSINLQWKVIKKKGSENKQKMTCSRSPPTVRRCTCCWRSTNSLQESLNKDKRASTSGNKGPCADFEASDGIRKLPFGRTSFIPMLPCPSDESASSSWKDGRSSFTKFPNNASNEKSP